MYGMIHRAARDFALDSVDEQDWDAILQRLGLDNRHFISGQHYDDATTFELVGALSELLGTPVPDLLYEFGRYWIGFTERSDYAAALAMAGDDLVTFLRNLDDLHHGIQATMPEASLPSFTVKNADAGQIELLYMSDRQGLETFVEGLLAGLLAKFSEHGSISHRADAGGVAFLIDRTKTSEQAA